MAWCVLLVLRQSGIVIDLYADMTWCLALLHVFYDLFVFVFVAFASDFTECVCQSWEFGFRVSWLETLKIAPEKGRKLAVYRNLLIRVIVLLCQVDPGDLQRRLWLIEQFIH